MKAKTKKAVPTKTHRRVKAKTDVIDLILEDHKPLKRLIKVLKNSDLALKKRQEAFEEFATLLVAHAKPEEESLYVYMKGDKEMRQEAFEGDVEHGLAEEMLDAVQNTSDEDLWSARCKVLAELVEHHIKEEEEEMLPDFRKHSEKDERDELGQVFLRMKSMALNLGIGELPPEAAVAIFSTH